MSAIRAVGDRHPGQYLPFWKEACSAGSGRACRYAAYLVDAYCHNGSGWACNEDGIQLARSGRPAAAIFQRGCELGLPSACANAKRGPAGSEPLVRSGPRVADLPVVLRGTKPPLKERDPDKLYALACEEGMAGSVRRQVGGDDPVGLRSPRIDLPRSERLAQSTTGSRNRTRASSRFRYVCHLPDGLSVDRQRPRKTQASSRIPGYVCHLPDGPASPSGRKGTRASSRPSHHVCRSSFDRAKNVS